MSSRSWASRLASRNSRSTAGELPLVADALDRRRQASAPVEIGVVASVLLPGASRGRQLPEGSELVPILRQPSAQPRPLTDQRLVGDLGRVVVDDQEPGARQPLEERGRLAGSPSGISSASGTRLRVSSVVSPSSVS